MEVEKAVENQMQKTDEMLAVEMPNSENEIINNDDQGFQLEEKTLISSVNTVENIYQNIPAENIQVQEVVETLEKQMQKTDERMDVLAVQVNNIQNEIFNEDGSEVEVMTLLESVNEVKNNYQNLRKEIVEVQNLQKQLNSNIQSQLKQMQMKFNTLKEKLKPPNQEFDQVLPRSSSGNELDETY